MVPEDSADPCLVGSGGGPALPVDDVVPVEALRAGKRGAFAAEGKTSMDEVADGRLGSIGLLARWREKGPLLMAVGISSPLSMSSSRSDL